MDDTFTPLMVVISGACLSASFLYAILFLSLTEHALPHIACPRATMAGACPTPWLGLELALEPPWQGGADGIDVGRAPPLQLSGTRQPAFEGNMPTQVDPVPLNPRSKHGHLGLTHSGPPKPSNQTHGTLYGLSTL